MPKEFRPFNYAEAISSGQRNALNAMKKREGVREVQGRNMLAQMASQGITGRDAINYANQAGRPDVAQAAQAQEAEKGKMRQEFAKRNEWGVNDQASWEAYNNKAFAQGHLTEDELQKSLQTDWRTGRGNLDRMMGRDEKTAKASAANKKMQELIDQGVDPTIAQGIGYGTLKVQTDPNSGDVMIVDTRQFGQDTAGGSPTVLKEGTKQEEKKAKKVESFSKEIEKSDIVVLDKTMSDVEELVATIRKDDPEADIPGYGATASIPDVLVSDEGKDLRQRVGTLFNMTLKDRSGAAVTSTELTRLKKEFGQGLIKTDQQLLNAIERFRGVIEAHKLTLAAGYDDDVVDVWQKRSGLTLREVSREKTKKKGKVKRYRINPETGMLEAK